jgi:predicted dehydrogenase
MEAGVDVLVEKPMATAVAEADAMVATAERTGRVLTVDHNRWFDPVVVRARSALEMGALGEITGVELFASFAEGDGAEPQAWKQNLPGGPIFDTVPHLAYLAYGFLGEPRRLSVLHRVGDDGSIVELRALVEGERATGVLTMSSLVWPLANTVALLGTKQSAFINLNNMTLVLRRSPKLPKPLAKVFPNLDEARQLLSATVTNTAAFLLGRQRYYPGIGAHLRAFYAAYRQGLPPPVSAYEGKAVVHLMEQLLEPTLEARQARMKRSER